MFAIRIHKYIRIYVIYNQRSIENHEKTYVDAEKQATKDTTKLKKLTES